MKLKHFHIESTLIRRYSIARVYLEVALLSNKAGSSTSLFHYFDIWNSFDLSNIIDNPFYTDIRYKDNIRYKDSLTVTKPSLKR